MLRRSCCGPHGESGSAPIPSIQVTQLFVGSTVPLTENLLSSSPALLVTLGRAARKARDIMKRLPKSLHASVFGVYRNKQEGWTTHFGILARSRHAAKTAEGVAALVRGQLRGRE